MGFFDLINEFRAKEARPEKAARAMKILALVCLVGGIWNYMIVGLRPFKESPLKIHPDFPPTALVTGLLLAALFYQASRGINSRAEWGKRLGQFSVALLVAVIVTGCYLLLSGVWSTFPKPPLPVLIVFSLVFMAQFVVPAYFGIRYLGRLPADENSYVRPQTRPERVMHGGASRTGAATATPAANYREAPVPFGVLGTFAISLAVPMIVLISAHEYVSPQVFALLFGALFLLLFAGPVLYNRKPSGFEQTRNVLASYTGGGSLFMFNGSWPFFRLLVYDDGVEIRVEYHRFFIPYDKMEDLPDKVKFFSLGGILFKSDLPAVPSYIRFYGPTKKILAFVNERRNRFLMMQRGTAAGVRGGGP
jgi:hypothetical protein